MKDRVVSDMGAERRLAVSPEVAGWSHLTFRVYGFAAGRPVPGESVDDEVLMMFLAGSATVTVGDQTWTVARPGDVFGGPPQCIYLPPRHSYLLEPHTACEVAYARWPAAGRFVPRFIPPETMVVEEHGSGATLCRVTHIVRPDEAEHLVCAEITVPPGQWWEGAPHVPGSVAEHVCYYRLDPSSGWALQRLYRADGSRDEVLVVGHGDAVMVRDEHHPVVAAPGCRLCVLHLGAMARP